MCIRVQHEAGDSDLHADGASINCWQDDKALPSLRHIFSI